MSREIKFRAWDSKFNVMLPQVAVYDNENVIIVDVLFNECYGDREDERHESGVEDAGPEHYCITGYLEMMQFVNKKDKSGNDIYEDDIIKINRYATVLHGPVKQSEGGQYYVEHQQVWQKYAHQIHCEVCETDSAVFFLDYLDPYEIEVIGNIYETPELLPDKTDKA